MKILKTADAQSNSTRCALNTRPFVYSPTGTPSATQILWHNCGKVYTNAR